MSNAQKSEVIEHQPVSAPAVQPQSESGAIISMIERAARDPAVDIDKMERLMAMRDRVLSREAQLAFDTAFAEMQPKLPVIDKKGRIEGESKRTGEKISQAHGRWEDISPAIMPILGEHGFGLRFRQEQVNDTTGQQKTRITAVLSHGGGHREEAYFDLPLDTSGSKNNVQAYGSTASYGKRYSATLVLNIVTKGEDDDGKAAGAGAGRCISQEQADDLRDAIEANGKNLAKFLQWAKVEKLTDIPAANYQACVDAANYKKPAQS
jgi:hypothetical protein